MAPKARVKAAFEAMKNIGIAEHKTKLALKKLLLLFDKNWDLIEEENYRVLADAIFEYEDTEVAEKEKKKIPATTDQRETLEEEAQVQDEPERPLKRLRLKHQGQATQIHGQPSPSIGSALMIPKPEPGEDEPEALPNPHSVTRNKGKQPISHQNMGPSAPVHVRDNRAAVKRASQALQLKEPKVEPGIITGKQKQSDGAVLIKVKDEPFTDDMVSLQPLAVVLPERSRTEASTRSSNPIDRQDDKQPGASKSVDGVDKGVGTLKSPTTEENHMKEANVTETALTSIDIAASTLGEVKLCLSCRPSHDFHVPDLHVAFKKVENNCIKTYKVMNPKFTVAKLMKEVCECVQELGTNADGVTQERPCPEDVGVNDNKGTCGFSSSLNGSTKAESSVNLDAPTDNTVIDASNRPSASDCQQRFMQSNTSATVNHCAERDLSTDADMNTKSLVVIQQQQPPQQLDLVGIRCLYDKGDITRGEEEVKVSLEISNCEFLPSFCYIARNVVSHNADVRFSLAQIGEQDCCVSCHGDCLSSSSPCDCAKRNGGESPYTSNGLVREEFLEECISMVRNPQKHCLMYCEECPLERSKNDDMLDPCKGHLKRKFIKECWTKCGCSTYCGNRVVQRGVRCNLQVFWTSEGKGWGLRTLEDLPKGAFVCEYVGEILTNTELHRRNLRSTNYKHSYSVLLDTDWGSRALKEEEVLCLDARFYGNVARLINHRCTDANLIEIPVEIETSNHHYYHVALFTSRKIDAFEELTWDYGVDFDDNEHHIKTFRCLCGSKFCRNIKRSSRSRSALTLR